MWPKSTPMLPTPAKRLSTPRCRNRRLIATQCLISGWFPEAATPSGYIRPNRLRNERFAASARPPVSSERIDEGEAFSTNWAPQRGRTWYFRHYFIGGFGCACVVAGVEPDFGCKSVLWQRDGAAAY